MKLPTLTEIAKSDGARFVRYEDGALWYRLEWTRTTPDEYLGEPQPLYEFSSLEFPIPVADAGAGAFLPTMRGIEVLRWARKHVEMLREAQTPEVES